MSKNNAIYDNNVQSPAVGACNDTIHTYIVGDEPVRKQISIESSVYNTIKTVADNSNNRISHGVVVYEILMMYYDYEDQYTYLESLVDQDLQDQLLQKEVNNINNHTIMSKQMAKEYMRNQIPNGYTSADKIKRYELRLPQKLINQTKFKRGWNDKIKQALISYIRSPYNSRIDRVQSKKNIKKHLEKGNNMTLELHDILDQSIEDQNIETVEEYKEADINNWSERSDALVSISKNNNLSKKHLDKIVKEADNIDTKRYRQKKINKIWEQNDLAYHVYESNESISERHSNLNNLTKEYIDKVKNNIKSKMDGIKVAETLVNTHGQIETQFVKAHIDPQIKGSVQLDKVASIKYDNNKDAYVKV
jgi:hypothetical protein